MTKGVDDVGPGWRQALKAVLDFAEPIVSASRSAVFEGKAPLTTADGHGEAEGFGEAARGKVR